ncbi:36874_t:CDS:2 [Gigaspora margarita]|uniref:36874_t:CDS:1 n=1 Tax=Gigaspora margarita TaxID=4874 RepID=A0ABM8VXJ5_GIGMA|nr:36874_t:CDS:2 [Gigaspora margarita]
MSTRSRKQSLGTEHNEINLALEALKTGSSTSATKQQRNTKDPISQSIRSVSKVLSTNKNNVINKNVIDVNNDIQNEILETSSRSLLNEISTNMLEDPFIDAESLDKESKSISSLLEITKKILEQNTLIMEKQEAFELCLLNSPIMSRLQNHHMKKGAMQGIKVTVDNWLYSSNRIYEQSIRNELATLCSDRMEQYKKDTKWKALFGKIEKLVSSTVNSESSEAEIVSRKSSNGCQKSVWTATYKKSICYYTSNLHNLFDPEITKIKFDEKYLTRILQYFLVMYYNMLCAIAANFISNLLTLLNHLQQYNDNYSNCEKSQEGSSTSESK